MSTSNFLSPIEFRLVINRLPETVFYVQSASIPGLSSQPEDVGTPFKVLPFSGVKLTYEDLTVNVIADENLNGFKEISNWLVALTFPDRYPQYKELESSENGTVSDMSLIVMDSSKNGNINIVFKNVFPISVSSIQLNTKETDVNPPTFDITFKYDSYVIEV